jgi:hypothetical protein
MLEVIQIFMGWRAIKLLLVCWGAFPCTEGSTAWARHAVLWLAV